MSVGIETNRNILKNANCPISNPPYLAKIVQILFVSSLHFIKLYFDKHGIIPFANLDWFQKHHYKKQKNFL